VDAFEEIVAGVLRRQVWWTMISVKVELTKKEKIKIERHSSPRWELDVVAYKGATNELMVVECKSLLDSYGVRVATFEGDREKDETRYKLFFEKRLRAVVFSRLRKQMVKSGLCRAKPKVRLGLAAGKVNGDAVRLREIFDERGWTLVSPENIRNALLDLEGAGYENSVAHMTAKIITRGEASDT
jgi:hypothetical protein